LLNTDIRLKLHKNNCIFIIRKKISIKKLDYWSLIGRNFNIFPSVKIPGSKYNIITYYVIIYSLVLNNDTYTYKFDSGNNGEVVTKRAVLSSIVTVFDPLSLIGPFVVKVKMFMQQIWTNKIGWDEKLPPPLCDVL
jgi:hypothetical protein